MPLEAVFLDFDDTLVDSQPSWDAAVADTLAHASDRCPSLSAVDLETAWNTVNHELLTEVFAERQKLSWARDLRFHKWLEACGVCDPDLASELNHLLGQRMLHRLAYFDDHCVIEQLRERCKVVIVTNGSDDDHPDSQHSKARHMGLMERVDGFFASDTKGMRKPNPRFILDVAEEVGVDPARVLFVGDRYEYDVLGANRAGMRSVLLWRVGEPPVLEGDEKPWRVIRSLHELLPLIDAVEWLAV